MYIKDLRSSREKLIYGGQLLALTVAYVLLGALGLTMAPVARFATLIWPPTGLALAALVLGGYRLWPAIAVGALVAHLGVGAPLPVACGLAVGNTIEALFGAFALRWIPGFSTSLERVKDVVGLAVLAGMVSTALRATFGLATLALSGLIPPPLLLRTWNVWWTGALVSDLIVASVLLTWSHARLTSVRPAVLAEVAALGASLTACAALVFLQPPEVAAEAPALLPHVVFLPLIWAALRFGVRGAATAVFAIAVVAVWGTCTGQGPFVRADLTESLFALHGFLIASASASLLLGAATSELRENAAALRAVIDGTPDAVYVRDRRGRYLITNTACSRLLGVTAEAGDGEQDTTRLSADEASLVRERDQEVLRTGQPSTVEESWTIGGQLRVYDSMKAPYRDRAGDVIGVIGISRDITDRKTEELSRAWLAAIVESSTDAVIGKTLGGTISSWNAAAERIYGYSSEEAIGHAITLIVPPERRDELAGFFDRICRGERIESQETMRRRKDGTMIEVALTLSPIRDSAGAVVGVSTISHDITERKRVEKELRESEARKLVENELRESEERQRLAVEAANLGVWSWDLKNDQLVWTPPCKTMHGLGLDEEVTYQRFLAMLHPDDRAKTELAVQRALTDCADDYRVEHRVVWRDGSVHWISGSGRVLCDERDAPYRLMGVSLDITAQKQADQERADLLRRTQAANEEAQAAARAKDEFLAVLSHELRTPLQSMLGWTQLLRAHDIDARKMAKGLSTIERNVKLQAQLIEDLLDVSRIVAGKLRLTIEPVDLALVVATAVESAKIAALARTIQLDATIEPPPSHVLGDPDRLQQVVLNLLSNAVKFTPNGGSVHVRLVDEGTKARLEVEDTGSGISAELLPHIFDRFRQAETTTVRSHGGLGLGLAIVRHLVQVHGGTVHATSPGEGRGTTLTVTLPLVGGERGLSAPGRKRTSSSTGLDPWASLAGMRVLVVDDDPDTRELLEATFCASGADVHAVDTARAALDAIASFHPHVLISDIGMPEQDGYSLIREVRAREAMRGGHIPAIALTAFASPADRERALTLGFEAHLTKPASAGDLVSTVEDLVGRIAG